jgi:hypothetical protein
MSHERCGPSQAPDQLLSKLPLCAMPVKGETPSALGLGPAGRGLPKAGQAGHARAATIADQYVGEVAELLAVPPAVRVPVVRRLVPDWDPPPGLPASPPGSAGFLDIGVT